MNVLYVRDLARSIEFYRALGIPVSEPNPERPFASYSDDHYTLLLTIEPAALRIDAAWSRPDHGYQQMMEFFVDDDAAVDELWAKLTAAGYVGTTAPAHLVGPYSAVIADPDGNPVMITNEPVQSDATV
jgi:catechol 2,3-dioxygenase-like lactoylglutathione lyase family enzyme